MIRPTLISRLAAAAMCLLVAATPVRGQEPSERSAAGSPTGLEGLAEEATRAVVLIDVRTSTDSRQGSGFIVDPEGLILTNHHVIRDAQNARVKLASGDVYERVVILADDPRRDIAIL